MDKKTLLGTAAGVVITILVGWFVTAQLDTFDRGAAALTEDQIKAVVLEMQKTPGGDSYGKALRDINLSLTTINTKLEGHAQFRTEIRGDLNSIRQSMIILAGGDG